MYQASRFQSDVHVSGGDTDAKVSILVNHPFVTAGNVYIYQASYGFGGNLEILALRQTGRGARRN